MYFWTIANFPRAARILNGRAAAQQQLQTYHQDHIRWHPDGRIQLLHSVPVNVAHRNAFMTTITIRWPSSASKHKICAKQA